MGEVYPLRCRPLLMPKVWGGRRLGELLGKPLPDDVFVGESWEVADLPEGSSTIANGPLAEAPLGEAVRRWGADCVGVGSTAERFPLLVKFLDANDDLSVQVHPSDEDCARWFPGHRGKDEVWIVIHVDPGGRLVHGFLPGCTESEFDRRLANHTLPFCLRVVCPSPGDVIRVAPGTIHALLAGVVVLEVQQPSDTTFRVYDYGRDTAARPLHGVESRLVLRFANPGPAVLEPRVTPTLWGSHELLLDTPIYRVERLQADQPVEWAVDPRTPQVLVCLAGGGMVCSGKHEVPLGLGDTMVLPAAIGPVAFLPEGPSIVVLAGGGGVPLYAEPGR